MFIRLHNSKRFFGHELIGRLLYIFAQAGDCIIRITEWDASLHMYQFSC